MNTQHRTIEECLLAGGVAVLRTDTLYGLVACAANKEAVERVYALKGRTNTKPCIILVAEKKDIPFDQEVLAQVYTETQDRATSVVVPINTQPPWLTRGGETLAYRVPHDEALLAILRTTGPLIAPSANPEGQPPAQNIEEAQEYFGSRVDWYLDGGVVSSDVQASRIISLQEDGKQERLR